MDWDSEFIIYLFIYLLYLFIYSFIYFVSCVKINHIIQGEEDRPVADRLIEIWSDLKNLIKFWSNITKSKQPKSKSCVFLKEVIDDVLYPAKLKFFSFCPLIGTTFIALSDW